MNAFPARIATAVLWCLIPLMTACEDDDALGAHSRAEAEEVSRLVIKAWGEGRTEGVITHCAPPLQFGSRIWATQEAMVQNLEFQVARLRLDAARFTEFEVYSHGDLAKGRWPRNRQVSKDRRDREIQKLGVGVDGFLVRVSRGEGTGWQLVLNSVSGVLKVQAVHP